MAYQKGQIGYWKGKKRPPFSEKWRENMGKATAKRKSGVLGKHWKVINRKGHITTIKTRRKISNAQKGDKGNNWIDGRTSENKRVRMGIETRLWRESVYSRDGWTCQKCGDDKGGNLQAHHIRNFAEVIELRTSIENGITFCKDCHKLFHKIYGRRNNTQEQLEEFLNNKNICQVME